MALLRERRYRKEDILIIKEVDNEALRCSAGCAHLTPPFKPKVRLPWPSKLGRRWRGPWAVCLKSEFSSS